MAKTEKAVMVVGIDDSDHSFYALNWTLDRFFFPSASDQHFKLVIIHAKISPTSVLALAGPGSSDVITIVDSDLKKTANKIVEKAKEICNSKSVKDVTVETVEGDPRNVMCDAAERHHASILVVGCHGYGAVKRMVLGSVSDYCAHHAHCSVMIVKKPKTKH